MNRGRRPTTRRLLLGALCTLAVALPAVAVPVLSPDATYVVVGGLAGDAESEAEQERWLRALVELLPVSGDVATPSLYLLTDRSADGLGLPLGAVVRPSLRSELVALGAELARTRGPLVFFLWGHGGLIGEQPVFHVRGPRIEPGDLATLAAEAGDRASTWLLSFRGSGRFGAALEGPGRDVFTTDRSRIYGSAPRAMELLLAGLKTDPASEFGALFERTRTAVLDWYETQGLARTEEPTRWPQLAADGRSVAVAAAPSPARSSAVPAGESEEAPARDGDDPAVVVAETPAEPPADEASAGDTAGWAGIEPVAADAYPDAVAVVLRRRVAYSLGRSPAYVVEHDEFTQILREEGTHHGSFDISYTPPGEKIFFLDCEVRRPDGRIVRLDPSEIREATSPPLAGYVSQSRKIFSLPEVTAGAIVRLHYRLERPRFPLPYFPLTVPTVDPLPLRELAVEVGVPKTMPFHYVDLEAGGAVADRAPAIEETEYSRRYRWRYRDRPAAFSEPLVSPDASPRLLMSTAESWAEFSAWYRRLIRLAGEVTPEIRATARELTAGATSDRERVERIYNFVAGLRYVAIPLGVNSHRPHAAQNVLEHRYGDCKDKANLFNTLLSTLDIPADLVLVPRFAQAHEAVPGAGFNHAISRVELDGEELWIDTTDDVARFGVLPPGDPGRSVLVIRDGVESLATLPRPHSTDHALALRGEVTLPQRADEAAPATIEVETRGFADYSLRSAARSLPGRSVPTLTGTWRPTAGLYAMSEQTGTPPAALERSFEWRSTGSWSALVSPRADRGGAACPRWAVRAPLWLPVEWEQALHGRRSPLYVHQGYPLSVAQTVRLDLPAGATAVVAPTPQRRDDGPLRWRVDWRLVDERADPRALTVHLELTLPDGDLSAAETPPFQASVRALYAALGAAATYELCDH